MSSPIEIGFAAIAAYLVIALVLAGSPITLKTSDTEIRFDVPPLRDVVRALKKLLKLERQTVGYQIRGIWIVLSPDELNLLNKPIKGRGGFQSFFRELSRRAEKESGVLYLRDEEIARIRRYLHGYGSGGYQSRLRQIFGRILPRTGQDADGVS